jgi:hypothetical protein
MEGKDDRSKRSFEDCVRKIVEDDGGRFEQLWLEVNGTIAHLLFYFETLEQLRNIMFDLEARNAVELLTAQEFDDFAAVRAAAD